VQELPRFTRLNITTANYWCIVRIEMNWPSRKKLSLQQACAGASEIHETEYNDSKLLVHGENRDELTK
jgi:hypothetical protein